MNQKRRRPYQSLADWLDRTGTQQQTLAKLARIKPSHLSMLLRGSRRCSIEKALRLSRITGVPVEKLVEWPRVQPPRNTEDAA